MQAWREWTAAGAGLRHHLDAGSCSSRRCPSCPPFLRGRGVVLIDGAIVEDAERAGELLAPLRALGPEMDTFADMAPVGLSRIHMDPEQPMPGMSDSMMLDGLTAETVDALVDAAGPGSGSPLLMVELRHLGGALGRYAGGALSRFDGEYLYFAAGIPMDPAVVAGARGALRDRRRGPGARLQRPPLPQLRRARGRPGRVLRRGDLRPPAQGQGRGRPAGDLPRQPRDPRRLSVRRQGEQAPPAGCGRGRPATSAASSPRRPPPRDGGAGRGAGPRPRSRGRSPSAPAARRRCAPPRASCESIVPSQQPRKPIGIVTRPGNVSDDGEPSLSGPGHTGGLSTIITTDAITPKATPVSAPAC